MDRPGYIRLGLSRARQSTFLIVSRRGEVDLVLKLDDDAVLGAIRAETHGRSNADFNQRPARGQKAIANAGRDSPGKFASPLTDPWAGFHFLIPGATGFEEDVEVVLPATQGALNRLDAESRRPGGPL